MINQRYLLKRELGRGRSRVFLCSDLEFPDKEIAIKILPKQAVANEQSNFRKEFFTLKKLNHPGIIKAFEYSSVLDCSANDFNVEPGCKFFTLEYFPGNTIDKIDIENNYRLFREIIKQICSTLFYLHLSDYIYFDLKVENILCLTNGNSVTIKLIDLGMAEKRMEITSSAPKGSAEYLAPELLQNKPFDHRVDLYSLGILLYRIVFKKFPFNFSSQLEIYKAHIETNFEIEQVENFPEIRNVISTLLQKKPENRFTTALQILKEMDLETDISNTKDFHPAKVYAGRQDIINIIKNFLLNSESSEIYSLHGFDGAGKSSVVDQIELLFDDAVIVRAGIPKMGEEFLKFIICKILYTPSIYFSIGESLRKELKNFIGGEKKASSSELRGMLTSISKSAKLIIVIDDYNQLDEFTLEFFQEAIPFLQVNGAKIIVTDNFGSNSKVKQLHNVSEIDLSSFTLDQLHEFIGQSFFKLFPQNDLEKIIIRYADLLPGSIISFISDIILLGVLKFSSAGIDIQTDEQSERLLNGSQEEIFKLRLSSLSEEELKCAQILSSFEVNLDVPTIQVLAEHSEEKVKKILMALFYQNIIQNYQLSNYIDFASQSIKSFVYGTIKNKKNFHGSITKIIKEKLSGFNKIESARHFEIAGDISSVIALYKAEVDDAEKFSAYSYQVKLLNKLSELTLSKEDQFYVYSLLAEKNYLLLNYKQALAAIERIEDIISDKAKFFEFWLMKAKSLIETNNPQEGKHLLLSIKGFVHSNMMNQKIQIELANAEYELGNYESSQIICQEILQDNSISEEIRGKAQNLIALYHINFKANFEVALQQFQSAAKSFQKTGIKSRLANTLNNIGNLHNIVGNNVAAELAWNEALELNSAIGSLVQEANQMINYGVYYHDKFDHQKAQAKFERARKIFLSLGDNIGEAEALLNLSELFIDLQQFSSAAKWLSEIINTFKNSNMEDEVFESIFLASYLNYLIGDYESLSRRIEEYSRVAAKSEPSDRIQTHLNFLKSLDCSFTGGNASDSFKESAQGYLENGDKKNYLRAWNFSIENLISNNQSETALQMLNDQKYFTTISNNIFYKAEKEYFLGRINKYLNPVKPAAALKYFEYALSLINDENILELTWKILLEIAICYRDLGQISKAVHYSKYAYSAIKYILENFTDHRIRNLYNQKKSVSAACEIAKSIIQNGG